jgi:hypothetical protein
MRVAELQKKLASIVIDEEFNQQVSREALKLSQDGTVASTNERSKTRDYTDVVKLDLQFCE